MKDRYGNEVFDTPEKVKQFLEWLFDKEVDERIKNGEDVNWRDYKKESEQK